MPTAQRRQVKQQGEPAEELKRSPSKAPSDAGADESLEDSSVQKSDSHNTSAAAKKPRKSLSVKDTQGSASKTGKKSVDSSDNASASRQPASRGKGAGSNAGSATFIASVKKK